jgi:hypothetical protein
MKFRIKKNERGFAPLLILPIVGGLVVLGIVLIAILPVAFLKIHMVQVVTYKYVNNNIQQALNTILYITEVDTSDGQAKPASKIIGRYVGFPELRPSINLGFLKTELDKMVDENIFQCYRLHSAMADAVLAEMKCSGNVDAGKYKSFVLVATGGMLSDQLELWVD